MTSEKRKISILLPIRQQDGKLFIFMQKRSATMERLPNYFGFWGGGAEQDETPEQSLQREIREELMLELDMTLVTFFNRYEFLKSIKSTFVFEPEAGWEDAAVIGEGDYGIWFSTEEALDSEKIIFEDKVVINDLEREFLKKAIR